MDTTTTFDLSSREEALLAGFSTEELSEKELEEVSEGYVIEGSNGPAFGPIIREHLTFAKTSSSKLTIEVSTSKL